MARILLASLVLTAFAGKSVGQSADAIVTDLGSPVLRAHAHIPEFNSPGPPLAERLAQGRARAKLMGTPWKGMQFIVKHHHSLPPDALSIALPKLYANLTCQADVIAVGRANSRDHHLSASGTTIYADYLFNIEKHFKHDRLSSSRVVVTRPGGALRLPEGHVTMRYESFPELELGATYLQFIKHIPLTTAYHPLDSYSTLVSAGGRWIIANQTFSTIDLPWLEQDALERSIGDWLKSCGQ